MCVCARVQGTDVCAALSISAKGPHVGAIINKMLDWQMLHLDRMKPIMAAHAAPSAAASSSSTTAPAAAPVEQAAYVDEVKKECFAWLATQNLAALAPAEKAKK